MNCPKCGFFLDAFTEECPRCKKMGQQAPASPKPAANTPPSAPHPVVIRCQSCGEELPPGAIDCPGCSSTAGVVPAAMPAPGVTGAPPPATVQNRATKAIALILFFAIVIAFGYTGYRILTDTSGAQDELAAGSEPGSGTGDLPTATLTVPSTKALVTVDEVHFTFAKNGMPVVAGTARNTSGRTLDYAQINMNLYDASGAQVGSTLAKVNNLEPGVPWKFEAAVRANNVSTCKVKGIMAF